MKPETHLVRQLMLRATELGARLFRNNVGEYTITDNHGQPRTIRYGLFPGSSDLIGWTPRVITAADVGKTVAVFTAVEAKTLTGRPTMAQISFLDAVRAAGGRAILARSTDDLESP